MSLDGVKEVCSQNEVGLDADLAIYGFILIYVGRMMEGTFTRTFRQMFSTSMEDSFTQPMLSDSTTIMVDGQPAARAPANNNVTERTYPKRTKDVGPFPRWKDAVAELGHSPESAFLAAFIRFFIWHWSQPLMYAWAYYGYYHVIGSAQRFWGALVLVRECIYVLVTLVGAYFAPSFLICVPGDFNYLTEDAEDIQDIIMKTYILPFVYVVMPEKFIVFAIVSRQSDESDIRRDIQEKREKRYKEYKKQRKTADRMPPEQRESYLEGLPLSASMAKMDQEEKEKEEARKKRVDPDDSVFLSTLLCFVAFISLVSGFFIVAIDLCGIIALFVSLVNNCFFWSLGVGYLITGIVGIIMGTLGMGALIYSNGLNELDKANPIQIRWGHGRQQYPNNGNKFPESEGASGIRDGLSLLLGFLLHLIRPLLFAYGFRHLTTRIPHWQYVLWCIMLAHEAIYFCCTLIAVCKKKGLVIFPLHVEDLPGIVTWVLPLQVIFMGLYSGICHELDPERGAGKYKVAKPWIRDKIAILLALLDICGCVAWIFAVMNGYLPHAFLKVVGLSWTGISSLVVSSMTIMGALGYPIFAAMESRNLL